MYLIIGLGNPGDEYQYTRHNIGFMAADDIVCRHNFSNYKSKYRGLLSTGTICGNKVLVFKPQLYMNKSGVSVTELVNFFKIPLENIIVIYDDLDLSIGRIKFKSGGGNGGHNGLKSLDSHISNGYTRLRIGIGRPLEKHLVSKYVLSNFLSKERLLIEESLLLISENIEMILSNESSKFMNKVSLKKEK